MRNPRSRVRAAAVYALLLGSVILLGGWVRFAGIRWDTDQHLHPDERYLTMVAGAIRFPGEIELSQSALAESICAPEASCTGASYWNTETSLLNPANHEGFGGYVYGTLPVLLVRAAALGLDWVCTLGLQWAPCAAGPYAGYDGLALVGRAASGLADLLTLVGVALLGRRLYGTRVSLLAALLYALSVLPIQHSHFFVVDTFATLFVTWTLLAAVLAMLGGSPLLLVGAGALAGVAIATKISVWPVVGIIALSAWVRILRLRRGHGYATRVATEAWLYPLAALLLSGLTAAAAFRVAQPYAFQGPGFWGLQLNPRWVSAMVDTQQLMSGLRDVPYGHQWANRLPVVFPWTNMVIWGLGVPLGVAAWVGWAAMGLRLIRHREWQHSIVWLWGTVFFFYQSTQWVKSMRYLLPIYPVFALFAAWVLSRRRKGVAPRAAVRFVRFAGLAVILGAWLWAMAFLGIYAQPVTRIQASEWMYDHIPTAVTLHTASGEQIHLPVTAGTTVTGEPATVATFVPESDATIVSVTLNRAVADDGRAVDALVAVSFVAEDVGESGSYALAAVPVATGRAVEVGVQLEPPLQAAAGSRISLVLQTLSGPAITLQTSVIANENWDDPLPLRLGGRDPFGGWYTGLSSSSSGQMNNYDNDDAYKRSALLSWLDEADYIVLSSNRLYASIPRLPQRYPLTIAYYQALFDGSLGFELVAEFTSYASLLGCDLPDQEFPFDSTEARNRAPHSRCQITLPAAEEAFSVYDHPRVLIFAKSPAYSRETAERLLPESLLAAVRWTTARGVGAVERLGAATDRLLMDARTQIVQRLGGTWSRIFDRQALQNRSDVVAALTWWLLVEGLGWLVYPVVHSAFPALRDRGYGLSKIIGLLMWSYVAWLLASLHLVAHTRALLWVLLLVGALLAALIAYRQRWGVLQFVRAHLRSIATTDLLFAGLFAAWVIIRALNPDLWHPVVGGEKPMDFAYFNAVLKSTWYPPYDPWFAGGTMNYYYFGFVMAGSLTKALGTVPAVAYNLAVATWFALTGLGAYTLTSSLSSATPRRAHMAGLLGVTLCLVLGNLGEVRLLFRGFQAVGNIEFESLIPGYPEAVSALSGLWKVLFRGESLGFRPEWWYWDATRMIPFAEGEVGPINEFPGFTFLYGDLHAHMLAYPLTQAALGLALQWTSSLSQARTKWRLLSLVGLSALVCGALRATNTWDYPTYTGLIVLGFLMGWGASTGPSLDGSRSGPGQRGQTAVWRRLLYLAIPFLIVGGAELLFRPFAGNYVTAYSSVELWRGSRTPLGMYLMMYGQFLFPLILVIIGAALGGARQIAHLLAERPRDRAPVWQLLAVAVGTIFATAVVGHWLPIAWVAVPLGIFSAVRALDARRDDRDRTLWLWVGSALLLSLMVEVVVLKGDISRMNTVFKFHLQVWMLFAMASAVCCERVLHELFLGVPVAASTRTDRWRQGSYDIVSSALACLLFAAFLYPALAIPAKVRDRWAPQAPTGLDGMAFMEYAVQYEHGAQLRLDADYRAILWLQQNVKGSPVIMEGQGEREYLWGNRVSVYTGLPSVVGWRWHQVQQRLLMPAGTVEERQRDVRTFYNTSVPEEASRILERYSVEYIVLAPYERAYMVPEGLPKFTLMEADGRIETVYHDDETTIYHVLQGIRPAD